MIWKFGVIFWETAVCTDIENSDWIIKLRSDIEVWHPSRVVLYRSTEWLMLRGSTCPDVTLHVTGLRPPINKPLSLQLVLLLLVKFTKESCVTVLDQVLMTECLLRRERWGVLCRKTHTPQYLFEHCLVLSSGAGHHIARIVEITLILPIRVISYWRRKLMINDAVISVRCAWETAWAAWMTLGLQCNIGWSDSGRLQAHDLIIGSYSVLNLILNEYWSDIYNMVNKANVISIPSWSITICYWEPVN